jgi:hypothetical protein
MKIKPKFDYVTGEFDTDINKLICVKSPKYGIVDLCFDNEGGFNLPFARIKLHSSDKAVDAKNVVEDAYALGEEIARRWNEFKE